MPGEIVFTTGSTITPGKVVKVSTGTPFNLVRSNSSQSLGSVPFWEDDPASWDRVTMTGEKPALSKYLKPEKVTVTLPGACAVTGKGFEQRVDKQTIGGKKGKKFKHCGYEPADIDITLQLWEPQHLTELQALIALIKPKVAKGPPTAVGIYHPALELYGVRTVVVLSAGLPERGSGGIYTVRLRCEEYVRPSEADRGQVKNINLSIPSLGGELFTQAGYEWVPPEFDLDVSAPRLAPRPSGT